jgi:hypothetical protein
MASLNSKASSSSTSTAVSGFEPAAQTLVEAFEARSKGKVYKDTSV